MTTPPTLDFASLVKPISEAAPTGAPLVIGTESSPIFSELRDARKLAGDIEKKRYDAVGTPSAEVKESQGRSDDPRKPPDWDRVSKLAQDMLQKHSKNLYAIVWLVDAQVRIAGLAGLRDGLLLCHEIVSQYWETLYPLPDDTDDRRSDVFDRWNSSSSLPLGIQRVPIDISSTESERDLNFATYQIANDIKRFNAEKRAELIKNGCVDLDRFERWIQDKEGIQRAVERKNVSALVEASKSARLKIATTREEFEEVLKALRDLDATLKSKLGDSSDLSLSSVVDAVQEVQRWFVFISDSRLSAINSAEAALGIVNPSTSSETGLTAVVEGVPIDDSEFTGVSGRLAGAGWTVGMALKTRDDAFTSLLRVAEFFRKTEPHSPVSYALEQAVRWGKMKLPELLKDLVSNSDVLSELNRRMGIQEPKEGDKS